MPLATPSEIKTAFSSVRERIERACDSVDRDPNEITLVAVTKTLPLDCVLAAYDLGHRDFGESRLQEAIPKIEQGPSDVTWHFIGNLQSNKAKRAAGIFPVIHTLHSESQIREIEKQSRTLQGLIEVNIAEEAQKSGIFAEGLDAFHKLVLNSTHVHFRGLMTVGPASADSEGMRMYFRQLRRLNEQVGGQWLSMGMSGDFDVAIQEGATHIRVAAALFGSRG